MIQGLTDVGLVVNDQMKDLLLLNVCNVTPYKFQRPRFAIVSWNLDQSAIVSNVSYKTSKLLYITSLMHIVDKMTLWALSLGDTEESETRE